MGSATTMRIEGLDVLRGVAVGLVVAQHALLREDLGAGIVGVVVFFALSGYLITGVLAHDLARHGRVRYGRFYRNRVLRLVPALVLLLVGYLVVEGFGHVAGDRHPVLAVLAGATYTSDLPGVVHVTGTISHLWTLATEEQFYLLWPAVLALALRRRIVVPVVAGVLVLTVLAAAALPLAGVDPAGTYPYPTSWATALVVGAAARLARPRLASVLPGRGAGSASRRHGALCVLAVVVLAVISTLPRLPAHVSTYVLGAPLIAVSTVVLIFWVQHWASVPHPAWRPVLALGTVSYATYLWSYPVAVWLADATRSPLEAGVGSVVLTVVAAAASWFLVERPVRDWRVRRDAAERAGIRARHASNGRDAAPG